MQRSNTIAMREKVPRDWVFVVGVLVLSLASGFVGMEVHRFVDERPSTPVREVLGPVHFDATTLDGTKTTVSLEETKGPRLLLILSVTCPYCEQNMGNWRYLASRANATASKDVLAPLVLSLSSAADTREYLSRHDLEVPALLIDSQTLTALGVVGTPTTIVQAGPALPLRLWSGVLTVESREDILRSLTAMEDR